MVPDCTDVHTARGPTPRKHPHIPSLLYIILSPCITDDVSRVAAPCGWRVVEGEEVEIGRVDCFGGGLPDLGEAECLEEDVGRGDVFGVAEATAGVSVCCVWMRVLTTSSGVVITPAIPPAVAAVKISSGNPMLFDPIYRFARPRSSS